MATPPVPPPVPGPPRVVTPAGPAPGVIPPPPPVQADVQKQATIDETPGENAEAYQGFWQTPFVQDWLPLLTSVVVHVSILAIGLIFFRTFVIIVENSKEPVVIPS